MSELTSEQMLSLKYKVEHPILREWCMRYGIIDCVRNIQTCIKSGYGYLSTQRVDRNFINSLSYNDRCIYNGVVAWLNS